MRTEEFRQKSTLRIAVSTAARHVGVRYFDLLYCEYCLCADISAVTTDLQVHSTLLDSAEVASLASNMDTQFGRVVEHYIDAGSQCVAARLNDELVAYNWFNLEKMFLADFDVRPLPTGGVYSHGGYVWPAYRGHRLFQYLCAEIYQHAKNLGREFVGNFVDRRNLPSIKVRENLGTRFQPVLLLKIGGLAPIYLTKRFVVGGDSVR